MTKNPVSNIFEAFVVTAFLTMGLLLITRPAAFGALPRTVAIIIGILFVFRGVYRLVKLVQKMRQRKDEV